ncbi:MAG: PPOX class F420-dependent oxidoreductase [Actinomycetota bacterium]
MEIEQALAHIREHGTGTLATLRPDGSPHLSVVFASVVDGALWISSRQPAVKVRNIRHDPRVAFSSGIRPWATIEGTAQIQDGDDVLDRLRTYYRAARGEHPDWDDYDRAMVAEQRLVIEITPARAYGVL